MKLRDLTGVSTPTWVGVVGKVGKMPVGNVGVVTGITKAQGMQGIRIEMQYEGGSFSTILPQWDGPPPEDRVVAVLKGYIGKPVSGLFDAEVTTADATSD